MAVGQPGGSYDLYREHVQNNPATYAPTGNALQTDDYRTNAVIAQTPTRTAATRDNAYGTQQTDDSWWAHSRQNENQT